MRLVPLVLALWFLTACQVREGGDVEADFGPPSAPPAASVSPFGAQVLAGSDQLNDYEVRLNWTTGDKVTLVKKFTRKNRLGAPGEEILRIKVNSTSGEYTDREVQPGTTYEYSLADEKDGSPRSETPVLVVIPTDQQLTHQQLLESLPYVEQEHVYDFTRGFLPKGVITLTGGFFKFNYNYLKSEAAEIAFIDSFNEVLMQGLLEINAGAIPPTREALPKGTSLILKAQRAEGTLHIHHWHSMPPAPFFLRIDITNADKLSLKLDGAGAAHPEDSVLVRLGPKRFFWEGGKEIDFTERVGVYRAPNTETLTVITIDGQKFFFHPDGKGGATVEPARLLRSRDIPDRNEKIEGDWSFLTVENALSDFFVLNWELGHLDAAFSKVGLRLNVEIPENKLQFDRAQWELLRYLERRGELADQPLLIEAIKKRIDTFVFTNSAIGPPRIEGNTLRLGSGVNASARDLHRQALEALQKHTVPITLAAENETKAP